MGFVVSSLSNYTKDNAEKLIVDSMFSAKFAAAAYAKGNVQTGIKTAERIHLLDTDVYFQDDSGCGFTSTGNTTFTARTITVGAIKHNESICPKDLRPKYTQVLLKNGSLSENEASAILAESWTSLKVAKVAEVVEVALVQGDTTSGNPNLNKFDGLLKNASIAAGAIQANTASLMGGSAATSFTTSNIRTAVDAVWRSLPEGVKGKDDVEIMIGTDLFDLYTASLVAANLFHYMPSEVQKYELIIPGTGYKLVGYPGFSGSNKIVGARWSNIFVGTDLANEEEEFKTWYSEDDDNVKLKIAFKLGIQVAKPEEVVRFDLA